MHEGTVHRGAKLELRAREGKVYYTLGRFGPSELRVALFPSAPRLTIPSIVLNDTTTVCCRVTDGTRWSYPATAKFVVGTAASEPK